MTKLSFFKSLLNFFNDPGTYFIGWKIILFIKENTLLTVLICGAVILAVIIFMSTDNELLFNIYLVSIAGIIDACWYIILSLAVTTASALSFFQTKITLMQKVQGFFFVALGLGLLVNLLI